MYKFILGILITLNCCVASFRVHATDIPVIEATGTSQAFTTAQQAAVEGLQAANQHRGVEYGGVVYQIGSSFYTSEPATLNEAEQVSFRIRLHMSAKIVALYHTHPGSGDPSAFSECDIKTAELLNVPTYIIVQETKQMEVFIPGVDKKYSAYEPPPSKTTYYSRGHSI